MRVHNGPKAGQEHLVNKATPNKRKPTMLGLLLTMTIACGPEWASDGGELGLAETTDDGDDGASPDDCELLAVAECDSQNRCWIEVSGWSGAAQYADPLDIQAGLDAGTLEKTDDVPGVDCYHIKGASHRVCVLVLDCAPLISRPLADLELVPSTCAHLGPWSSVGEPADNPFGECWGTMGRLAIRLMPTP